MTPFNHESSSIAVSAAREYKRSHENDDYESEVEPMNTKESIAARQVEAWKSARSMKRRGDHSVVRVLQLTFRVSAGA